MSDMERQRDERLKLLEKIEELAQAPVLVYFTADSPIVGAQISDDALLPMFEHLRAIGNQRRLALYIYSSGGVMETPWKIVTMLREFCDELDVIVPYKAHSAATMIAIGADKIYMTRKAELSPIDPALQVVAPQEGAAPRLPDLGVEDVAAYVTFIRERAKLTDQSAVAALVQTLAQHLTPPLLGRLERTYSHIRLVARNLLSLHKPPFEDRQISAITEALTEKIYAHGHGIGRKEANEIGLDVRILTDVEEGVVWSLYELYESVFRLRQSREVESYFPRGSDLYESPDTAVASIESLKHLHAFIGTVRAQRLRRIPPNPTINVNLALNFPPNIQPQQLPQAIQQAIQQLLQQAVQQINALVGQALQQQAPEIGVSGALLGAAWRKLA